MTAPAPAISVCICTRDRGDSIVATLKGLMASRFPSFEAVIIDQSSEATTRDAVQRAVGDDVRFRYYHSQTSGLSAARNVALTYARGEIIAWTDDDCEVAEDWLERIAVMFERFPQAGQVSGSVAPGDHDPALGFIPDYPVQGLRVVRSAWRKWQAGGIGANMSHRREVLDRVGPFDEILSPGGPLYTCDDGDMTFRVLRAGYAVVNAPDVRVVHNGFRTWEEGRVLMRHTGVAVGALSMKHVRMGDLAMLPALFYEWGKCISWSRLLRLQGSSGLARFAYFHAGLVQSFRFGLDRERRVYCARKRAPSAAQSAVAGTPSRT